MDNSTPVLIYVPGLGHEDSNTADRVAEVLAVTMDRIDNTKTYSTKSDSSVVAPKSLKVAKTIVDSGDHPCLQLFELDYTTRLEQPSGAAGPPASPGVFRSMQYAVFGAWKLLRASHRPAKTFMPKLQLWLGYAAVGVLILAFLVSVYAALIAAGLDLPTPIEFLFDADNAGRTFVVGATGVTLSWAAFRKKALALATTIQYLLDYTSNSQRVRATVCLTVDDAVSGLLDNGWTGEIHLLGYSFGSLVLFDAAYPDSSGLKRPEPFTHVTSLVTVGCPLDIVRLYYPDYTQGRQSRQAGLPWTNVYNAADVFGSNLKDEEDVDESGGTAVEIEPFKPKSVRYLQEKLTLGQIFMARGFKTHAGYWGTPAEGHCFENVIDLWWQQPAAASNQVVDDRVNPPLVAPDP